MLGGFMEDDFVKNFKLIQINETFAPQDPTIEELQELDDETEQDRLEAEQGQLAIEQYELDQSR
jgi:hypothetical protein